MTIYFCLRIFRQWDYLPDLLSNYGTDLLFVPAMCLFTLFFIIILKGKDNSIPTWMVLTQTLFISIYFEWYLPNQCDTPPCYVSDFGDVYAYFIGAIAFIFYQRSQFLKIN